MLFGGSEVASMTVFWQTQPENIKVLVRYGSLGSWMRKTSENVSAIVQELQLPKEVLYFKL